MYIARFYALHYIRALHCFCITMAAIAHRDAQLALLPSAGLDFALLKPEITHTSTSPDSPLRVASYDDTSYDVTDDITSILNSASPRSFSQKKSSTSFLQQLRSATSRFFRPDDCNLGGAKDSAPPEEESESAARQRLLDAFWTSGSSEATHLSSEEEIQREIPEYVLEHAPLIYLYDKEEFWPSDIAEHLLHTTPHLNYTPLEKESRHPNLTNLDELNARGPIIYLQSNDNVEDRPNWLTSRINIPVNPDKDERPGSQKRGGRSSAPAILVVVKKPHGIVDAFWFFFYSYNLGNTVVRRFGNHVGDWEHTLVRFQHGEPKEIFFSEHSWGNAYTYQAVEKIGKRPVGYSAVGSHAMYGNVGVHSYVLPFGLLHDQTSRGPLWDPLLNAHSYTYNLSTKTALASNYTPKAPVSWFNFAGRWGDKQYPLNDPRQYLYFGIAHYVSGPTGPRFKYLARKAVCQGRRSCVVKNWIGQGDSVEVLDPSDIWPSFDEQDEHETHEFEWTEWPKDDEPESSTDPEL